MRIALVINTSWNIYNFRLSLIQALQAAGHEVVAIAPEDAYSEKLKAAGCRFVPLPMDKRTNPFMDLRLLWRLYRTYQQLQPDVVLHYTIKPNVYGALAANWAGIPSISNLTGLGTVFITQTYVSDIARLLYRIAFRYPAKVFFQNEDDRQLFLQQKLVRREITDLLPGSGVNLQAFTPAEGYKRGQPFTFLMVARVLYDKGVAEFVEASKLVQAKYPDIKCQLLGPLDETSSAGVKRQQLDTWLATGAIEYLGTTDDVAPVIRRADCVVLPSYREGTPRTLLEAAAMAKPLIATDVPGCREVVQHEINGYLCQVRNAGDLAAKMLQLLALPDEALHRMGQASRQLAITRFDDRIVIERYLKAINLILN
ncbi:glycosyltransferase family 4 protein [Pontibacter sp. CAU 1760]